MAQFGDACYVNSWGLPLVEEDAPSDDQSRPEDGRYDLYGRLTVAYLEDDPPERVQLLEETLAPVAVSSSPIHGLGVFATRDIAKGEVIELAPSLPLEGDGKIDAGILDSYTFDQSRCIDMLQLGYAAIYNHSDAPNVSHVKFRACPYLEAWTADVDIEEGQELFHDYGQDYFDSRGMRKRGERPPRVFC